MGTSRAWALLALLACLPACACDWPLWERFAQVHISADGRVIDYNRKDRATTSEGQSYALFFALLAGDRARFARLLQWTENNLSAGRLDHGLPAWLWGRRPDGSWGVLDDNSASDADAWMAYALLEAGRLWQQPRYRALGQALLQNIRKLESLRLPGLGWVILPGRHGFHGQDGTVRLNPSYPVLFHWRRFAVEDGWWAGLVPATVRLLQQSAPRGLSPDWAQYRLGQGVQPGATGSYDAIRVYLWLGMLAADDPEYPRLTRHFRPMLALSHGPEGVPLKTHVLLGRGEGQGPSGFQAALYPLQQREGFSVPGPPVPESGYYNQVLHLFQQGWQNRYRPDAGGYLRPRREGCS